MVSQRARDIKLVFVRPSVARFQLLDRRYDEAEMVQRLR